MKDLNTTFYFPKNYLLSVPILVLTTILLLASFVSDAQTTVSIPCTGASDPNSGRIESTTTRTYGFLRTGVTATFRGWTRFNLPSYVPSNATITAAEVDFYVQTSSGSATGNYMKFFVGNTGTTGTSPMTATAIWNAIGAASAHEASTADLNPAGAKTRAINATGIAFLNANKTSIVNLGFMKSSGNFGFYIYGSDGVGNGSTDATRKPVLRVTYTVPCTASTVPTGISGTTTVCAGTPTTLTSTGGTLGTNALNVWYAGGCGVEAFNQDWDTQPYTLTTTTLNASPSYGIQNFTSTSADPNINITGLSITNPTTYKYMNVRFRVTSATQVGAMEFFWYNTACPGPGACGTQYKNQAVTSVQNVWQTVSFDMSATSAGSWAGSTITGFRFDWTTNTGVTMDIDYITLTDRPVLAATGTDDVSLTVTPTVSTTYYTAKRGPCGVTACVNQPVTVSCSGPVISTIPSSACAGETITITGTDLSSASAITINSQTVTSITSNTSTQIQFVVPAATTGSGNIVVTTPGGTDTKGSISINTPPTISLASVPAAAAVCSGTGVQLNATGTSTSYSWAPATGLSATTGASVTATPSSATIYTVTGTLNTCNVTASQAVTIGPPVAVAVTATPDFLCAGNSTALSAVYQPFPANTFTSGLGTWSTVNNSTGGCPGPAPAAWTVRASNYTYTTPAVLGITSSYVMNFGTGNYILSDGQAQYEGVCFSSPTTDTRLNSAVFSTIGFTGVTLNFNHVFLFGDSTYSASNNEAFVEVSTNGSTWTTIQSYGLGYQNVYNTKTTTGTFSQTYTYTPLPASINLNAYAGLSTVYVRFRYRSNNSDGKWAIDNINITPSPVPTLTYAWTSSPAGFTSAVASPTATVNQTTTYSVVATSGGCSSPATPALVTVMNTAATPGAITGSSAVCSGSSYVYSIAAVNGASTYTWSVPSGWGITGNGTTSITITANNNSGNISVTETNCIGVSLPSVLAVTSTTLPVITFSPTAPAICLGTGTVVTASSTATSYAWTPSTGLSSATVANPTANPIATTLYSVVGTLNGCPGPAAPVTVTVNPVPVAITASLSPTTVCAGANVSLASTASSVTKTLFRENFETASAAQTKLGTSAYIGWKDQTITGSDNFFWIFDATRCGVIGDSYSLASSGNTPATSGTMPTWTNSFLSTDHAHVAFYATPINATNYTQLKLNFKWKGAGNSASNGKVCYSTNGTTWTDFSATTYRGQTSTQTVANLDISAMNGQTFYIGFRVTTAYNFAGNAAPAFTVDDISITGVTTSTISYAWSSSPSGYTAATQNATANPNANTTYTVVASDNTGCSVSSTASVAVNARPTSVVSGNTTLCGGTTNVSVALTGAQPWALTWYDGTTSTNVTGITSSPYLIPLTGPIANKIYTVTALSDANCTANAGDRTGSATVTIYPRPTSVVSGNNTICSGASTNVSVALTGTQPWDLTWYDGTTSTNVTGITSSPYLIPITGPIGTKTYTVTALEDANCTANAGDRTGSATITVNPRPTADWDGPTSLCLGVVDTFFVNFTGTAPYTFTYTDGIGSPVTVTNHPSDQYFFLVTAGTLATRNFQVTALTDANCTAQVGDRGGVYPVTVTANCVVTWTGAVSTSWHTAGNWDPNVEPNSCNFDIYIPKQTNQPSISTKNIQVGNVTLESGIVLSIGAARKLSVCKNWTMSSGVHAVVTSGDVILNGTTAQTITGGTIFDKLIVNNSSTGVTNNGNIRLNTGLVLQDGDFTNTYLVTLKSSATGTAYLDNFTYAGTAGTYTGDITSERYNSGTGNGGYSASDFHYLTSPVATSFNDWSEIFSNLAVNGNGQIIPLASCDANSIDWTSPYGAVMQWNEAGPFTYNCSQAGWYVFGQSGTAITKGRGYTTYLKPGQTVSVTGTPTTGNVPVSLTNSGLTPNNPVGPIAATGQNLVGNPYPSPYQWDRLGNNTNIGAVAYAWQATSGYAGTYQPIAVNNTIAVAQGFMVLASTSGTYNFQQNKRQAALNPTFYKNQNGASLVVEVAGNTFRDRTEVAFNDQSSPNFDFDYDGYKMMSKPAQPTLYTGLSTNKMLSINMQPSIAQAPTVPMGMYVGTNGNFNFTFDNIASFDPTTYIFLEDKKTATMQDMRANNSYSFVGDTADAVDRFVIHFTPPMEVTTTDASCTTTGSIKLEQPGTASWTYTLKDNGNNTVSTGTINSNTPSTITAANGVYTLDLVDAAGYSVSQSIQVNGAASIAAAFSSSANSVHTNEAISVTNTTAGASSYTWDFGDGSTPATTATASHSYAAAGTYTVTLYVTNAAGCQSSVTRAVTVSNATGIAEANANTNSMNIFSFDDKVIVDFSKMKTVEATVQIYNLIGQELSNEKHVGASVYTKELNEIDAAYVLVRVKNSNGQMVTKKVFISNSK